MGLSGVDIPCFFFGIHSHYVSEGGTIGGGVGFVSRCSEKNVEECI